MSSEEVKPGTVTYNPQVLGDTGLRQYGGYLAEEFLKELRGLNGAKTYREMQDNDPTVGAVLYAITMLIRQCKWNFQAVDETPEADIAKDFAESIFSDMSVPFSTVITEACSMFTYGFAPMEIIWKKRGGPNAESGESRSAYDDGKIGIRNIALRAQNTIVRWEIDQADGSIDGVWQQPIARPMVMIPIEKLLLFRTTEERNNPEGRSAIRTAYRPWYFKKRIEEIEGIGVERDLAGLPVAYIPGSYFDPSADSLQKQTLQAWKSLITQVRRDQQEGILLPSDRDSHGQLMFDIKLLSTGGSRTFDTSKIVDRYNRAIATSVLADFIFLGQQSVGSFALSSDKTALFATAVGAFTKQIADVINRHLMPRLWKLNGMDLEYMPTLMPGDLEKPSLPEIGQFLQQMTAAGAPLFPDRELENHLRDIAGFPPAPEETDETQGGVPGADPSAQDGEENPDAMPADGAES